ncbi:hypothetical protein N7510_010907 [Penicillium lagena]|uniref:uncharacterized protein n=1 Tax=Penicillium lagena TaxID=94218 RepID=UPI00253FC2CA|nr:uncharacterized protein N7510_010907 [Penicillium lagena]KAJ5601373.1 hypothetical protein N7510_010907 [Penicillium lagena]
MAPVRQPYSVGAGITLLLPRRTDTCLEAWVPGREDLAASAGRTLDPIAGPCPAALLPPGSKATPTELRKQERLIPPPQTPGSVPPASRREPDVHGAASSPGLGEACASILRKCEEVFGSFDDDLRPGAHVEQPLEFLAANSLGHLLGEVHGPELPRRDDHNEAGAGIDERLEEDPVRFLHRTRGQVTHLLVQRQTPALHKANLGLVLRIPQGLPGLRNTSLQCVSIVRGDDVRKDQTEEEEREEHVAGCLEAGRGRVRGPARSLLPQWQPEIRVSSPNLRGQHGRRCLEGLVPNGQPEIQVDRCPIRDVYVVPFHDQDIVADVHALVPRVGVPGDILQHAIDYLAACDGLQSPSDPLHERLIRV